MTMNGTERILRMVENDSDGEVRQTLRLVRADLCSLLCEFMSVQKLDMSVGKIDGAYRLTISADVDKFYSVGKVTSFNDDDI